MNLRGIPYAIDFVGNAPDFVVQANSCYVYGRKYTITFGVENLLSGKIFLTTPYFTLTWKIVSWGSSSNAYKMSTAASPYYVYLQFVEKLLYNYTITLYYDVTLSYDRNKCYLTLSDKNNGYYGSSISYGTETFQTLNGVTTIVRGFLNPESETNGVEPVYKNDYRILAKYIIRKGTELSVTPEFFYVPFNEKVTISTDIIRFYFDDFDLPVYNETLGVYNCDNVIRFVSLLYAEMYDNLPDYFRKTKEIKLINGKLEDYSWRNNIPDWTALNDDKFYKKTNIDIFGQNNNAFIKTHYDTEQYLYISNLTDNTVFGTLRITVNKNGTTNITSQVLTFGTKTISRLPVSLAALGVSVPETVTTYSVSIESGSDTISRNFIVTPKPFYGHTLLLLNNVNLYESFTLESMSKEKKTEGELVLLTDSEMYSITDMETVYTASTGWKTASEMAILESAVEGKENMLLEGQYGLKFSVVPDTFTIIDESEDLLSAELQFIVTDKINRTPIYLTTVNSDVTLSETILR